MAATAQHKQHLSDDEDTQSGVEGVQTASSPPQQLAAAAAAAIRKAHRQSLHTRVQHQLRKLRSWLWHLLEELLEEFQPWLKWIIFDAVLTLVVGQLVKHVEFVRPMFEAVGWA